MKDLKKILESDIEICDRFSQAKSLPRYKRSYYEGMSHEARSILYLVNLLIEKETSK